MQNTRHDWLEKLYHENHKDMLKLAVRIIKNFSVAEELVQETFLLLTVKTDDVVTHANPVGWLYVTLRKLLLNEMKKAKYKFEFPLLDLSERHQTSHINLGLYESLPSDLTSNDRQLLTWAYEDRLSFEEMSARLNITVPACQMRLHRLKLKLKRILKENSL